MRIEKKVEPEADSPQTTQPKNKFGGGSEKNRLEQSTEAKLDALREKCRVFVKTGSGYLPAFINKNKDLVPLWLQNELDSIKGIPAIVEPLWYSVNMMESTEFALFTAKLVANHPKIVIKIDPETKKIRGAGSPDFFENNLEKLKETDKDCGGYVRIRDRISGLKQLLPEPKNHTDSDQHEYSNFAQVVDSYVTCMLNDLRRKS